MDKKASLKELQTIPGVGKTVAHDLYQLGFKSVAELKNQDPELLYVLHNKLRGAVQDICMLYTFRCAVYFAKTPSSIQDPEKLKWWNWMDKQKVSSIEKDLSIRKAKGIK